MTAQTGILLESCKAGVFLEANITDYSVVSKAIHQFLDSLEQLQQAYPDPVGLGAVGDRKSVV